MRRPRFNWLACIGWLVLCRASGTAALVYSGPQAVQTFGGSPAMIDIDANLQNDLTFLFAVLESDTVASGQFIVDIESGNSVLFQGGLPALLSYGTLIQESPTSPRQWRGNTAPGGSLVNLWTYNFDSDTWSGWSPPLLAGDTAYLGVQFQTQSGMRLGWVEVEFQGTGVDSVPVIAGWAYETDPVSFLTAGLVPEPSTIGLLMLGLGAWGIRNRRRPTPRG